MFGNMPHRQQLAAAPAPDYLQTPRLNKTFNLGCKTLFLTKRRDLTGHNNGRCKRISLYTCLRHAFYVLCKRRKSIREPLPSLTRTHTTAFQSLVSVRDTPC
jgi:hypothetical protein